MSYKHDCNIEDAAKFADWCQHRGGVAVWASVNLSNPGATWSTPATIRKGDCVGWENDVDKDVIVPYPRPSWQAASKPSHIVSDPAEIGVYRAKEVKRFHVGVRRTGVMGMTLKVTDAGSRKIWKEVEKAGEGAFHGFDYETQDAVIYQTETICSLKEWIEKEGKV